MDQYINSLCMVRRGSDEIHQAELLEHRGDEDHGEFYAHFVDFDRRMDEWVPADRVNLSTAIFLDSAEGALSALVSPYKHGKRKIEANSSEASEGNVWRHQHHRGAHSMDPSLFSRLEAEREEITKVKNIPSIVMGRWRITPWYYSPYPDAVHGKPLFICDFTLKYMTQASTWQSHRASNKIRAPPGSQIYSDGALSLWEVDGAQQKVYCQNLCLLSKLFLDHKTLYFETTPFLFYILTSFRDDKSDPLGGGHELIGYFSKEKVSDLEYNLACILTFPPFQRLGYGKLLISLSYELTKREHKVGSPEKPLSDLGKLSYRSYWTFVLLRILVDYDGTWTLQDLSTRTGIKIEDVISTLQALDLIKYWKGQYALVINTTNLQGFLAQLPVPLLCDGSKLTWQPKAVAQEAA